MTTSIRTSTIGSVDLNYFGQAAISGVAAGVVAGAVARLAMRFVALLGGLQPSISVGGTLAILLIGAVMGAPFALLYSGVKRFIPLREGWKGPAYGAILALIFVAPPFLINPGGELTLVKPAVGLALFAPIPLVYGALLEILTNRMGKSRSGQAARRVALGWAILFGLALALILAGAGELGNLNLPLPKVAVSIYRGLGISFIAARILHALFVAAFMLAYGGMAAMIFWRGFHSRMAKFTALVLLFFASAFFTAGRPLAPAMSAIPIMETLPGVYKTLSLAALLALFYIFPDGRFFPGWTRPAALVWTVWLFFWFLRPLPGTVFDPATWPEPLQLAAVVAGLGSGFLALVIRARGAHREQRLLILWPAVGMGGAVLAFALLWSAMLLFPDLRTPGRIGTGMAGLFSFGLYLLPWLLAPLGILRAMARHHLWSEPGANQAGLG